ncbi:MAG: hypothetical protein M0027_12765 [Candidatus Dormibacteraeota bacterium]|jgi:hypothetical protein|nr:hypothetical protein [Candidatus Dormibacteraeota bacterium]
MRISALRSDQLLVDARQAARMLGLADRTFRALVARGDLPKVTLLSRVARYRVEDIRGLAGPRPAAWPAGMAGEQAIPSADTEPTSRPTPEADRSGARPHRLGSGRRGR